MAQNNDLLYNAALAGFVQGAQQGRGGTVPSASLVTAAAAFAKAVDLAIPNDATISGAGGLPILQAAGTAATVCLQNSAVAILQGICAGLYDGRVQLDATSADYNAQAATIATLYAAAQAAAKST